MSTENVIKAYLYRAWDQIKAYQQVYIHALEEGILSEQCVSHLTLTSFQSFAKPRDQTLLPNLLPPPYQKPYTLILELKDILIHTDYDVMSN